MNEIEKLEETIKYTKEHIKKLEDIIKEAGDDGVMVATKTRASLALKKRLQNLEQKLQALQLKETKEKGYTDIDDVQKVNQEKKTTLDKFKEEYQEYDVRDVVGITDKKTKEQLCTLFGIKNPEEVEIYAVHTYNETTWKDSWLGQRLRKR